MAGEQTVRDYVTLIRGITYKGNLVGKPGPALLGLGSIHPGGGFREGAYKTYGGDCPPKLMLTPGDLFVSLKGATKDGKMIGSVARVPVSVPSGRLTQDTVKLEFRTAEKAKASSYLYWLLRTPQYREYCDGRAMGSAVVALSRDDFLDYPVPRISGTRKSIVEVLERIEDKIELNRRMNATLEAMARALFQSWFIDFDPVRKNMDRNQPSPQPSPCGRGRSAAEGEGAAGLDFDPVRASRERSGRQTDRSEVNRDSRQPPNLDPATAALFPDSFQDSELGHIPAGWAVKTIDELAERVAMGPFGSDIKVSTFVPEGIPVISGQHLRGTLLDDSEFNFVTEEHADRLKRSNVQRGDVIFTHAGSIGQVAYIPEASRYKRYIVSQRQFYMRCNRALVSPFYITSYFKTHDGQHRLLANTSSTGVPSISQPVTYLRQLKMVVPPPALLNVFDETVSKIHLKMADNDHQSRTLATLRDTLLPKLLSGELSVGQIPAIPI